MMATMNPGSLLLIAVATAAAAVCIFTPSSAAADCPWRTVVHLHDPFIQNLGKWAVEQQHAAIRFIKVESTKAQGVGQCTSVTRNFELIIVAALRGRPGDVDDYKYKAVVYVTNFTKPQKVISFAAISPPAAN